MNRNEKRNGENRKENNSGKTEINTYNRPHEGDNYQAQRQTTSKKEKERVNKRNK
jgi:hypothetical protein